MDLNFSVVSELRDKILYSRIDIDKKDKEKITLEDLIPFLSCLFKLPGGLLWLAAVAGRTKVSQVSYARGKNGREVVFSIGDQKKVTFSSEEDISDPQMIVMLRKMYLLMVDLNEAIPEDPIQNFKIIFADSYMQPQYGDKTIVYYTRREDFLDEKNLDFITNALIHEQGHGIFDVRFKPEPDQMNFSLCNDPLFNKLFYLLLGSSNIKFFAESTHSGTKGGHPHSNPSEFFASLCVIFRKFPNQFIKAINRQSDVKVKKLAKYAWVYMRDRVFNGKTFLKEGIDPYSNYSVADIKISDAEALETLLFALDNVSSQIVKISVILALGSSRIEGAFPVLYQKSKEDKFSDIYYISALGRFGDKRAIPDLVRILQDKGRHGIYTIVAAKALSRINDTSATLPMIAWAKANQGNKNVPNSQVVYALAAVDDPRVVPFIESFITTEPDEIVRLTIADGLGRHKKTSRSSPLLARIALSDSSPKVRKRAIWALSKIAGAELLAKLISNYFSGKVDKGVLEQLFDQYNSQTDPYLKKSIAEAASTILIKKGLDRAVRFFSGH